MTEPEEPKGKRVTALRVRSGVKQKQNKMGDKQATGSERLTKYEA